ncbi:hypothetical protein [Arthrobacter woluwensis]|uniref:hypothetical protein n=1 Tax=Arthrobacter woluwensis TaxID=156980 RepID=UPI0011A07F69|nr:hypothetical protein [Arthrobacter woluwensis]
MISPEHIRTAWRDCGGNPEDFDHWLTLQRSEWFGKGLDACADNTHGVTANPAPHPQGIPAKAWIDRSEELLKDPDKYFADARKNQARKAPRASPGWRFWVPVCIGVINCVLLGAYLAH